MNRTMQQRLAQSSLALRLESPLQVLLDGGFVERDGCVSLAADFEPVPEGNLLDRTGREALVNHVHVEDRLVKGRDGDSFAQAVYFARALAEQLASVFPSYPFDVVVAVGDSSTVRFYRRRENEPPWVAVDLDGYNHEALLVLAVG